MKAHSIQLLLKVLLLLLAFDFAGCGKITSLIGSKSADLELIPYRSGEKYGYIDIEGKIVINPQFDDARLFKEGLALVRSGTDKWGYIDKEGKYVVNPQYYSATSFSEGLACVVTEAGQIQFINTKGDQKLIVENADVCGSFSEGLAPFYSEKKWGFLDDDGEVVINPQFSLIGPFKDGMASIGEYDSTRKSYKWGFINKKGEILINYQFYSIGNFNKGISVAALDEKKYGFIDETGKYLVNPMFDWARDMKNNSAPVKQGDSWGYIDKEGKFIINPQFKDAFSFGESGIALVKSSNDKYGYIDKDGKYLINPQFDAATDFYGSHAFVSVSQKWGIIDKEGKYTVNPQFDYIFVYDAESEYGGFAGKKELEDEEGD